MINRNLKTAHTSSPLQTLLPTLALCLSSACGASTTDATQSRNDSLQAALEGWAATSSHQGVSAAVTFADGTRWEGAAGQGAVTQPLRSKHLILIASITKTMTGAVILQLADEGSLSLDDAVSRWLPAHPGVDPSITVRQLLNHTSGVANYTTNPRLSAAITADPARTFSVQDLLGYIGSAQFPPGTRTQYTNTAFLLLGQIAEQVTGESIVALYHQRLWGPLGLTEIYLPGHEAPPGPVAASRGNNGVVDPLDHPAVLSIGQSAFGLMATARTVTAWGHALFTSNVISAAMQSAMRMLVPAAGNIPGESGAGLGIRSYGYLGRTQFGHSGGSSFGSSLLLHDPTSGITVAVLMNQGQGADHFLLAPQLLEIASAR